MEKPVHLVGVAGEDHHEVVAVVLHHLQQDFNRLLPVVALVLLAIEVIGLVDEQHAAHRLLQHLFRLRRGVADILADEIVAGHRDEMAAPDVAELVQDLGHAQATVVLPVPGLPVKLMCSVGACARQAEALAHAVDQQQRRDLADALLDRREADQLVVELLQHRADAGLREFGGEIDLRRGASRARPRSSVSPPFGPSSA